MRIPLCFLIVLASAFLSGCETTDGKVDAHGKYWELGSPVGTPIRVLTLYQGTSADEVREFLGEPKSKKTDPTDPSVEEWIYERRVIFGESVKSMNTSEGYSTVYQPQQSLETARIKLRAGLIDQITITRARDQVDVQLPFERTLSGH
jgi:hypothetical protein